jgi:GT2 family glycosyltransferase
MNTPSCDLVLLSWNHLDQTRPCLESLFETVRTPSRLFIVDNGSEPAVRAFLRTVKPRGMVQEVVLLQNETNEGFPRGMNRGIRASTAPFVCLLNNDLRFAPAWLEQMLEVARSHPTVGVVNPNSNTFGAVPPEGMTLAAYAGRLAELRGQFIEVGMCIGFCFLIRRQLLEQIGGLTEEVERIFFEDEDFSARAQQAGFQCVAALSAYVFHAEHQTVRKMPEREALFARNRQWCHARWGRWVRVAWPRFEPVVPGSEELRRWLARLQAWARRRVHIYVFGPLPAGVTKDELFRSVGLVPHADVRWYPTPRPFAPLVAAGWVLKRRKKPFDIVVAPDGRWAGSMRRLARWHRAAVVPEAAEEELAARWNASRFPSSS